jgi:hypothetical protein
MANKDKTKKPRDFSGIVGLLLLFVVASIAYSTSVIVMGTTGPIPLIMVAPQALFALYTLVKRFTK